MSYQDSAGQIVSETYYKRSSKEENKVANDNISIKLIGRSSAMQRIRTTIDLVADSRTPVLITGESGTGKEIVARLIHQKSPRIDRPFLAINCAALPKEIFENELFGHEHGAFTGATGKKQGYWEMADSGTIFFDELAEMNPDIQAKLLRVLETKSFRRLGGKEEIRVDVRTLAATNKNLQTALETGELRTDLYYRFSVIEIYLPPLRDRKEDIPLLIHDFINHFCLVHEKPRMKLSEEAFKAVMRYDWPGNIRELKNLSERLVIMNQSVLITPDILPEQIRGAAALSNSVVIPIGTSMREVEKTMILQTLASVSNNQSRAAKLLGLSRRCLHNKLLSYKVS